MAISSTNFDIDPRAKENRPPQDDSPARSISAVVAGMQTTAVWNSLSGLAFPITATKGGIPLDCIAMASPIGGLILKRKKVDEFPTTREALSDYLNGIQGLDAEKIKNIDDLFILLNKANLWNKNNLDKLVKTKHIKIIYTALNDYKCKSAHTQADFDAFLATPECAIDLSFGFWILDNWGILAENRDALIANPGYGQALAYAFSIVFQRRILAETRNAIIENPEFAISIANAFVSLSREGILEITGGAILAKPEYADFLARAFIRANQGGVLEMARDAIFVNPECAISLVEEYCRQNKITADLYYSLVLITGAREEIDSRALATGLKSLNKSRIDTTQNLYHLAHPFYAKVFFAQFSERARRITQPIFNGMMDKAWIPVIRITKLFAALNANNRFARRLPSALIAQIAGFFGPDYSKEKLQGPSRNMIEVAAETEREIHFKKSLS